MLLPERPPRACANCRFFAHLVALGLGGRCRHPAHRPESAGERLRDRTWAVPGRDFVCQHHVYQEQREER